MLAAHPDQIALVDAINAHPDEDTVRLEYADWLQEHPHPGGTGVIGETVRIDRELMIRTQLVAHRADASEPDCNRFADQMACGCDECRRYRAALDAWAAERRPRYVEANRLRRLWGINSVSGFYVEPWKPTVTAVHSIGLGLTSSGTVIAEWDRGFVSRVRAPCKQFFTHAREYAEVLCCVRSAEPADVEPAESVATYPFAEATPTRVEAGWLDEHYPDRRRSWDWTPMDPESLRHPATLSHVPHRWFKVMWDAHPVRTRTGPSNRRWMEFPSPEEARTALHAAAAQWCRGWFTGRTT